MNYTPLNIQNKSLLESNWFIKQKIHSTLILNSPIKEEYIRSYVSDHFQIDTFNGSPILSVVIQHNDSLAFKYLPFLRKKKSIHVQLRTYVKRNGVPGIFLLSLDTDHKNLNSILKPLTDFPIHDVRITSSSTATSKQIDFNRDGLNMYANIELLSERVFPADTPILDWINNRFHLFNIQKGQVVDWKIDHAPYQVSKAKIKNIQFNHSFLNENFLNFEKDCFLMGANTLRIWPPSQS